MMRAALATLVLVASDRLERRVLGHKPVYDPGTMGKRLFGSACAGEAMRWIYGPSLGFLQRKLRIPALFFGPLIAAAELIAMPLTGATPPVRKWPRGEVPLLFVHATAFALAAR